MKTETLQHSFVQFIPEELEDGVLYVSIAYCTATHKCVCGCGSIVVTPITPTDWRLTFNGETVSLSPSIGNWNFACQSHYWITNGKIRHASKWDKAAIESGRKNDLKRKRRRFAKKQ